MQLAQGGFVVLLKGGGRVARTAGIKTEFGQRLNADIDRTSEGFAIEDLDPAVEHLIGLGAVAYPYHQRQTGKMLARQIDHAQGRLGTVQRHDPQARFSGAGRPQQVQPGGITVMHGVTEAAQQIDLIRVLFDDGGADAIGVEQPGHDLPAASEPGNDDR